MKTMILFIALAGFTAVGSYAQDKGCGDKHKTVANKAVKAKTITPRVPVKNQDPTCFMLKKKNLGVPGCVDVSYDGSNSYMGYYPKKKAVKQKAPKATTEVISTEQTEQIDVKASAPIFKRVTYEAKLPCRTYVHNDIIVRECPDEFYSNQPRAAGMLEYSTDNTYMGYYPDEETKEIKDPRKMENRQIQGTNFPGDDLCYMGCGKRR